MRLSLFVAVAFVGLSTPSARGEMVVLGYSSPIHDRYYPDDGTKAFLGDAYDWSGVGRTGGIGYWATMISDTYFISALHHHPADGDTITFFLTDIPGGASETAIVESGAAIPGTDLWIGKLVTAPSTAVERYAILDLPSTSDFLGLTMFVAGKSGTADPENMRLGRNVIEDIDTVTVDATTATAVFFDYDSPLVTGPYDSVGADEAMLVSGDSGGPNFVLTADGLALVGINWFVYTASDGSVGSGSSFIDEHLATITAAMAVGGEAPVSITAVPEPATWIACTAALAGAAMRRRFGARSDRRRAHAA